MSRTQEFYGTPGSNSAINASINNLSDAFSALSIDPRDNVAQSDFLNHPESSARQIREMALGLQTLRANSDQKINDTITQINDLLNRVDSLNDDIQDATISNRDKGDLEDQRDLVLEEL